MAHANFVLISTPLCEKKFTFVERLIADILGTVFKARIKRTVRMFSLKNALCCLVGVVLFSFFLSSSENLYARSSAMPDSSRLRLQQQYGKIPLAFEPNQGQAGADVRFIAKAAGLTLLLKEREATLLLPGAGDSPKSKRVSAIRMLFPGANFAVQPQAFDQQSGVSHYLLGKSEYSWHTGVPNFARVGYRSVYPGVDLVFYGNQQKLEHDFVISPGADYRQIRVRIEGAEKLLLGENGALALATADGALFFHAPEIYQYKRDKKVTVPGRYVLISSNEFSFKLGQYDRRLPLVIDPVLGYSTYLAGSSSDSAAAIAIDSAGSAYVTGYTFSNDFPTKNPEQGTCNGSCAQPDAFVTKFSPDGSALVYSTFVGGSGYDQAASITVDSAGNALVAGSTSSFDFPQKNGLSAVLSANQTHGFAFSLDPAGSAFNFSTYLGGINTDSATGVAFDAAGDAYIAGYTSSMNFPLTPGNQIGPSPANNNDVFLTKLNGAGGLIFSTLIGGTSPFGTFSYTRYPVAVTVDKQGEALLAGAALDGFPTTPASFQPVDPGTGNNNAFLALLNNTGSAFTAATYLGGTVSDNAASQVVLDSQGDVYVTGVASSLDFPTTPGAFQTTDGSGKSVSFVTKMNASLSSLIYSTYLGPTQNISSLGVNAASIAVDASGNAYIAGYTDDPSFPLVNPLVGTLPSGGFFGTGNSAFLSVLNPAGSALSFSTFFSGSVAAQGTGVALDSAGNAYLTGFTFDPDFPTTSGAFQSTIPTPPYAMSHPFVTKFAINTSNAGACLSTSSLFLGYVQLGKSSPSYPVSVTNCGTLSLQVSSVTTINPVFAITRNGCKKLLPGASCTVTVRFTPQVLGASTGNLVFSDNAPISPQNVQLSGYTATGFLMLYANGFNFPDEVLGLTSPPILTTAINQGQFPIHIASITSDNSEFAPINHCPAVLQPGQSCSVGAMFTPTAAGSQSATISINDDAAGSPQTISVVGNGLTTYPTPSIALISPTSAVAGSSSVKVSIYGLEAFSTTLVTVNGKIVPWKSSAYGLDITLPSQLLMKSGSISLQLINPPPGGASNIASFTVYNKIGLQAADLVYEPFTRKLYASIPASATINPNSLVSIDPVTGVTGTPIPIGNDPRALGISDDGTMLYVGLNGNNSIVPFNLQTQTVGAPVFLGSDPQKGLLTAATIQVQPGHPSNFVVTLSAGYNGADGVALVENGTIDTTFLNEPPNNIALGGSRFINATTLFGWNVTYGSWGLDHFVVSGKNLFLSSGISGTYGLAAFDSDGKYLYDVNGQVFDATTGTLVGTIPQITGNPESTVLADTSSGRLFFLGYFQQSVGIQVIDSKSLSPVGGVNIGDGTSRLLHFGPDGLAFLTSNFTNTFDLITTRTSLFFPSVGPNAVPAAISVTPATVKSKGTNFLLTVAGSKFVRGAVVQWNGANRTTKWVGATKLIADIPFSDITTPGKAKISVLNPAPGGGLSVPLSVTIQ